MCLFSMEYSFDAIHPCRLQTQLPTRLAAQSFLSGGDLDLTSPANREAVIAPTFHIQRRDRSCANSDERRGIDKDRYFQTSASRAHIACSRCVRRRKHRWTRM